MKQFVLPLLHYSKPSRRRLNRAPIGTVREWYDSSGTLRAYVKVAPHQWLPRALVVYELHHGPVPDGYVVHHKDRNSLNDDPDNLVALTRAAHVEEHRYTLATIAQRSWSLWLALWR